jgi:hypothetical protein
VEGVALADVLARIEVKPSLPAVRPAAAVPRNLERLEATGRKRDEILL